MQRGQVIIVEQVLLFAIGILVLGGTLFLFQDAERKITNSALENHFENVGEYVANVIVDVYLAGKNNTIAEGYVVSAKYIKLPEFGEYSYLIRLEGDTIYVTGRNVPIKATVVVRNLDNVRLDGLGSSNQIVAIRFYKPDLIIRMEVVYA